MRPSKVLLADDHTVVRAGLRNALGGLSELEITGEVGNGRELMEALSTTDVDLLVMDANMPDFEPISAAKEIKAKYPQMKILIVSAYADETYVVGLLKGEVPEQPEQRAKSHGIFDPILHDEMSRMTHFYGLWTILPHHVPIVARIMTETRSVKQRSG